MHLNSYQQWAIGELNGAGIKAYPIGNWVEYIDHKKKPQRAMAWVGGVPCPWGTVSPI